MKYIDVLKESLQEADVTKTSDILGPMVEPILGYDGDGDLVTHKNASDILKKYYFENDSDGIVTLDDNTKTVTDGEPDQSKIDKVKKTVEDIIKSDDETNQPTEKTLKEMVSNLEDILIGDEDSLSESDSVVINVENLLAEDSSVINQLESLLEEELDAGSNGTKENDDKSVEDETNEASKDVIIDKDTKVKREADESESSDEENDEADEKETTEDGEEKTPLDVDENLKEMDIIESMLQNESVETADFILNDIETILGEQNELVSYESPMTSAIEDENDIDTNNPMHGKVTTESLEDSILEWLIMEIEDKADSNDEVVTESNLEEGEIAIEEDILSEALSIFDNDEEISSDMPDELNDFKVSKIDSSKIRV